VARGIFTNLTVKECVVKDSADAGVSVWGGAVLKMMEVSITGCKTVGISGSGTGSIGTAERCQIRNCLGEAGVKTSNRATIHIKYSQITGNMASGIAASNTGTCVVVSHCEILDQYGKAVGGSGVSTTAGIKVFDGAAAAITNCVVNKNHCAGVCASGPTTRAIVSDTELMYNDKGAWGFDGAHLQVERIDCRNNTSANLSMS